jgi:hypothetical protein
MRKNFETLSENTKKRIEMVDAASNSFKELLSLFPGREASIAITHMETAVMWANKAFVINDVSEKLEC